MNNLELPFGILVAVLLTGGGYLMLMATRRHQMTIQFQLRLFLIAFAVRFGMSLWIYAGGLINVLKDEDGSGWVGGVGIMKKWELADVGILELPISLLESFQGHHRGYFYLLGTLFYLTDAPGRIPAAALNCFFGALTVILAYRVTRSLFSEWVATRVAWLVCLMPSMFIWSSQTVKEPVIIFLEAIALYGCVQLKVSRFSTRYLLVCVASIVLLLPFRFYAAFIAGAAVAITLALPKFTGKKFSFGTAVAIVAMAVPLMMITGGLAQTEAEFEKFDIQRVQNFKKDVAMGEGSNSGVKQNFDLRSSAGMAGALAYGSVHLLLAPFPWQLGGASLRMLLTLPELLYWWWLVFVGLIPGFRYLIRHRFGDIQAMLFFVLGLGFLYSLMFGNVGLVFRQRAQLLPWLLIFAVVGLEQRYLKKLLALRQQRSQPVSPALAGARSS